MHRIAKLNRGRKWIKSRFVGVKFDGDLATIRVHREGVGTGTMEFKRVGDDWKLDDLDSDRKF